MVRAAQLKNYFSIADRKPERPVTTTLLDGRTYRCRNDIERHIMDDLMDGLKPGGGIDIRRTSIRQLFENLVEEGREAVQSWGSAVSRGDARDGVSLVEDAVDTSRFSNITGQIVFSEVMAAYNSPVFIFNRLLRVQPTTFLDGERIPGITNLGDVAEAIGENQAYPYAGVSESYIDTDQTIKRGFIVPITKEAVIADRTGVLLERAGRLGQSLAMNREKRGIDVAIGASSLYSRNGGAKQATYGDTHTQGTFDNLVASNGLVDYTDVDNAMQQFNLIKDPDTGEPIMIGARQLLVPQALELKARSIINATEIRSNINPSAGTADLMTVSPNPLNNAPAQFAFEVLTSPYVSIRTSSSTTWFFGDFQAAFRYMEVWPITQVTAPTNSELEFTHDIVAQYKVSERGREAVIEPRYVVKCTA